jgi:His-Xaa-Ser system radical SAM maturase HxsB
MKFASASDFLPAEGYRLLPFRFGRLPGLPQQQLMTSMAGQWLIADHDVVSSLVEHRLDPASATYADLEAKGFLRSNGPQSTLAPLLAQLRTRKSFLFEGPSLHIIVVSLRCHHTCGYCQVSRQTTDAEEFDLQAQLVAQTIDRIFEWPSKALTVEFQGGEPLLAFDRIRDITERIVARNEREGRLISFVIASTLHHLTPEILEFFRLHRFKLSTSLDGPEALHNANRPTPERNSYARTVAGIELAREALGSEAVSALTTITRKSLECPEEIVDEYVRQGFHSIFLRPLSPYGFARKNSARFIYPTERFHEFYRKAFDRIIHHNRHGHPIDEAFASLTLGQMLSPYGHGYVDLRSPTGAGFGAIIYDYTGKVYPSDEARMLAAMGDERFCMGDVSMSNSELMTSPAMERVLSGAVAESIPGCHDCVFLPFCGSDPIDSYARQGGEIGHRPSSDFCSRQTHFFQFIFERWHGAEADERRILSGWAKVRVPEQTSTSVPAVA